MKSNKNKSYFHNFQPQAEKLGGALMKRNGEGLC